MAAESANMMAFVVILPVAASSGWRLKSGVVDVLGMDVTLHGGV